MTDEEQDFEDFSLRGDGFELAHGCFGDDAVGKELAGRLKKDTLSVRKGTELFIAEGEDLLIAHPSLFCEALVMNPFVGAALEARDLKNDELGLSPLELPKGHQTARKKEPAPKKTAVFGERREDVGRGTTCREAEDARDETVDKADLSKRARLNADGAAHRSISLWLIATFSKLRFKCLMTTRYGSSKWRLKKSPTAISGEVKIW